MASTVLEELAASESRLHMMVELLKRKVGFADIEEFSLGLNIKYRSKLSARSREPNEWKFVKAAMECKLMMKE